MGKKGNIAVREHSQERDWLLSLGKGNIFKGVQNLIEKNKMQKSAKQAKSKK